MTWGRWAAGWLLGGHAGARAIRQGLRNECRARAYAFLVQQNNYLYMFDIFDVIELTPACRENILELLKWR